MANGTESEEYVLLSGVRRGLKREFAFAWKSQSEFAGTIGRRRVTRSQNGYLNRGVSSSSSNKRLKSSSSKEVESHEEKPSIAIETVPETANSTTGESDTFGDGEPMVASVSRTEDNDDVVAIDRDEVTKNNVVESAVEEAKGDSIVEPMSELGTNTDDDTVKNIEETLGEALQPVCIFEQRTGNNAEQTTVCDAVQPLCNVVQTVVCDTVEPACQVQLGAEDHDKNDDTKIGIDRGYQAEKSYENVQCSRAQEGPSLGGEAVALLETPLRRITRSALKPRGEHSEISVSEDLKSEEVTETGSEDVSSAIAAKQKLEKKKSKKIVLKRFPTKLKELLVTGLLEGLPVRYLRGPKVRALLDTGLRGIVKGTGILCYCSLCDGAEVVTPNQFELHAGSANKRPPEYIYLENGNTLRDVLNACKDAPLDELELTIQRAAGCSSENKPIFCLNCKGSIPEAGAGKTMLLCNSCLVLKDSEPQPLQISDAKDSSPLFASTTKSTERASHFSSSGSKSQGRLTRKDIRMHKLVFEEDVLADGTALAYYARGQKLLEGYKKGSGIFCLCCNSEVSPSQFEAHAGWASRRKPYLHIYTSNGVSLHELSIRLSKERKLSAEQNDDLCSICADGGDLLCCDNCPRAFHTVCVSLPSIPMGTWYCKYCVNMFQKEKFVERNANAVAAGRVTGTDAIEEITQRCIRIVKNAQAEVGGCMLCRHHDFSKSGFGPRTVILCDQCEKEYHVGCLKEHEMDNLKELPQGKWFCCTDCNRIHSILQKLVFDGGEKLSEPLLNVIKKKHEEKGSEVGTDHDIKWKLLSGKMASDETRVLLSKAVSIFHDRFDPIADANTSRLDLIPHMVYGRNLRDQEFGGMYCAILTVDSTVVSAGIIRIFGKEVAELPLVATSAVCQGQGYFQSLFFCIQNLLQSLNVKNLVLPAADEAESLWINKFGFEKITQEQLMQYRKDYQMMIFQGTSMLHKSLTASSH